MFKKLFVFFAIFLTACGWQFKNSELFPEELRTLSFESADQYSEMSSALRQQILRNDIKIVPKSDSIAHLRLTSVESYSTVASVFKQAREAEKILSLTVTATATLPNLQSYPLDVSVHRTFFDDSRAALAKHEERESVMHQLYEQAAHQLLIKMAGLHTQIHKAK